MHINARVLCLCCGVLSDSSHSEIRGSALVERHLLYQNKKTRPVLPISINTTTETKFLYASSVVFAKSDNVGTGSSIIRRKRV
jgi:hypothetical protein